MGSRGGRARAGRGEGGYARASRATAGDGIGSDRPRGNSIETRDERMARAPCDGRGAREKRPRPMSRPRGAKERVMREKNGGARALTGQQALDEAEDLPDPLALSGDLVMIAHLPRAALPEQPERVGKRLREVGWRIRLAAAGREPNHLRRGHPRKGRTAGRVGAVVPAAAASRRSNFRSRGSGTFLDRVRDPALDPRASRGRGVFPHASRSLLGRCAPLLHDRSGYLSPAARRPRPCRTRPPRRKLRVSLPGDPKSDDDVDACTRPRPTTLREIFRVYSEEAARGVYCTGSASTG